MILSSAMSPSAKVCDQAYDIPRLNKYFDFVSIMTYDYHGQWDKKTGHVRFILILKLYGRGIKLCRSVKVG